jgi:hypothetical protein
MEQLQQAKVEQTKCYQEVEIRRLESILQTLRMENEDAHKICISEKKIVVKLEATRCK